MAVVVDSGASIGQMLLYLSQFVPTGKLLAFEPYPCAAVWLQECLAFHSYLPVELIPFGLAATPSQVYLQDAGGKSGHGACSKISELEEEGIAIQVIRLGDVLAERSISRVDLWCLDVEGYELLALQGAESLLQNQAIHALYIELSDLTGGAGHRQAIQDFMAHFGYQSYRLDPTSQPYIPSEWSSHSNSLFLPR